MLTRSELITIKFALRDRLDELNNLSAADQDATDIQIIENLITKVGYNVSVSITDVRVTDPIENSKLNRLGSWKEEWELIGHEMLGRLLENDSDSEFDSSDQWVNVSLTVGPDSFTLNRTISINP